LADELMYNYCAAAACDDDDSGERMNRSAIDAVEVATELCPFTYNKFSID